jgi:hypothetical protein
LRNLRKIQALFLNNKYLNEKTQYYNTNSINKAAAAYEAVSGKRYSNAPAERTSSRVKTKSRNDDYDDDYGREERVSKSSYLIVTLTAIAAVVVIIVVIFIAITVLPIFTTESPKGEMPSLIGFNYLEAKNSL